MGQCPKRILVVDDDRDILERLVAAFDLIGGHIADCAATGDDALIKMEENDYDLIISDFEMFGMNGLDLLNEVRRRSDIPMMLMSGFVTEALFREALAQTAFAVVQKPIQGDYLIHMINHVLSSDADPALAYYEAALDLGPDRDKWDSYSRLLYVYKIKGQTEKAKELIKQALSGNENPHIKEYLQKILEELETN